MGWARIAGPLFQTFDPAIAFVPVVNADGLQEGFG
jgi:hypothetical protein